MEERELDITLMQHKTAFQSGCTRSLIARINYLDKIYQTVKIMEKEIADALYKDLGKCATESYLFETGMVLSEISFFKKHLKKFMKERRVKSQFLTFPGRNKIAPRPYGTVLIMSPWNYPFQLTMIPLVDAIAAGNTAIIKPSAYSPNTSAIIHKIIDFSLPNDIATVIEGGRAVNQTLLDKKYDYIFFTGSKNVGKLVLEKAAYNLTPVTLELGGKSPCVVDCDCDIKTTARRIAFGKFINAGQTCVAPDYLFVHKQIKNEFLHVLKAEVIHMFGNDPLNNPDYSHIINQHHYERLLHLLKEQDIFHGGDTDGMHTIAPTILDHTDPSSPIMQEEIFGPILPVMEFTDLNDVYHYVNDHDKPLSAYYFSSSKEKADEFFSHISCGGGCFNDTIMHVATHEMGFGGVGESGMGSYHGKAGFDTFTHYQSLYYNGIFPPSPSVRYPKYNKLKDFIIHKILK